MEYMHNESNWSGVHSGGALPNSHTAHPRNASAHLPSQHQHPHQHPAVHRQTSDSSPHCSSSSSSPSTPHKPHPDSEGSTPSPSPLQARHIQHTQPHSTGLPSFETDATGGDVGDLLQELRSTALQLSQKPRREVGAQRAKRGNPVYPAAPMVGASPGRSSSDDSDEEVQTLRRALARERHQHSATVELVADLIPRLEQQQKQAEARHVADLAAMEERIRALEAENERLSQRHVTGRVPSEGGRATAFTSVPLHAASLAQPPPSPMTPRRRLADSVELPQRPPSFRAEESSMSGVLGGTSLLQSSGVQQVLQPRRAVPLIQPGNGAVFKEKPVRVLKSPPVQGHEAVRAVPNIVPAAQGNVTTTLLNVQQPRGNVTTHMKVPSPHMNMSVPTMHVNMSEPSHAKVSHMPVKPPSPSPPASPQPSRSPSRGQDIRATLSSLRELLATS